MKHVMLFTDGSCFGNPGPGGWACLLRCGSVVRELSGAEPETTNNRMELQAVIAGLSALKERCSVKIVTDSQYVQRAMTTYLPRWISAQWRNARGAPVANRDLWDALVRESSRHEVIWTWVRGHGASAEQNRCDELAQAAARSLLLAA
ncbi:MAG TPA: ribonuclease HI [Terriglobales bacterium]|nr:ribonuclease HI [Terriglobales bacterium]